MISKMHLLKFDQFVKSSQRITEGDSFFDTATNFIKTHILGQDLNISQKDNLMFNGDSLQWMNSSGKSVKGWSAVSGLTAFNTHLDKLPLYLQSFLQTTQQFSQIKEAGPIPEGKYTVGPIQQRLGDTDPVDSIDAWWSRISGNTAQQSHAFSSDTAASKISWGNFRAPIRPISGTTTYGRGDFYIHGGSIPGSIGCIDLTDNIDDFAKFFIAWTKHTGLSTIPLTVKYADSRFTIAVASLSDFLKKKGLSGNFNSNSAEVK